MKHEIKIFTKSEAETTALGRFIGKRAEKDLFLALIGDLAAGKTHFVQGLAQGMGISGTVTSPTFTILNFYDGSLFLAHFDFYRLKSEEELWDIGWEEYAAGGVTVAEWAKLFPEVIPADAFTFHFAVTGETEREILISWESERFANLGKELETYAAGD